MDPERTMAGAWLCHRCTGLYGGGLVGVVAAGGFRRACGWRWQLLICAALLIPIAVDGVFLGRGSAIDTGWWRMLTGVLGGLASGLFFGARGGQHIDWPDPLTRGAGWLWGVGVAAFAATVYLRGWRAAVDVAVLCGLFAMCLVASAWALHLARIVLRRLGARRLDFRPFAPAPLVLLVGAEWVLVALLPSRFKPSVVMVRDILEWLGLPSGG